MSSNLYMIVVMSMTLSSPLRPPFRKRGVAVRWKSKIGVGWGVADHEQSLPENGTRVNVSDHVWSSPGTRTVLAESWNKNTNGRERPCFPHWELEHEWVSDHVAHTGNRNTNGSNRPCVVLTGSWNMNNNGHERPCWSSPGSRTRTIFGVSDRMWSSPETGTRTPMGMRDHVDPRRELEHEHQRAWATMCGPHQELEHEPQWAWETMSVLAGMWNMKNN